MLKSFDGNQAAFDSYDKTVSWQTMTNIRDSQRARFSKLGHLCTFVPDFSALTVK